MKVFKVNLYRIHYPTGMMMSVSPVIVQKKAFSVKEILTGYSKINMVPKTAVYEGKPVPRLDRRFWNPKKKISQGEHLVVIQEDLCAQNQVKAEDIDAYVEEYESSKWKRIYDEMKRLTRTEKTQMVKKVNEVKNIKQ